MRRLSHLRIWTQKVLPLVYDDSLSYYEVLCKVVAKVNEIIGFITTNIEDMVREVLEQFFAEITYVEETQSICFNISEEDENA